MFTCGLVRCTEGDHPLLAVELGDAEREGVVCFTVGPELFEKFLGIFSGEVIYVVGPTTLVLVCNPHHFLMCCVSTYIDPTIGAVRTHEQLAYPTCGVNDPAIGLWLWMHF